MKRKNGIKSLKQGLRFLEALKVQLEDRDLAGVGKSMSEYGLLVPIVVVSGENASGSNYESAKLTIKTLRAVQIKSISDAITVLNLLLDEFDRSIEMPLSALRK